MFKHRRIASGLVAIAAVAATAGTALPAQAAAPAAPKGNTSLATVLAADGNKFDKNWGDFDITEKAVLAVLAAKPNSPVKILTQGNKAVTAFIPTDAAFRRLGKALTGKRAKTEKGVFNQIAKAVDVKTLEAVLLYHVVPGATVTYAQAFKSPNARLTTAQGGKLIIRRAEYRGGHVLRLQDKDPNALNAKILKRASDINKGNKQIAHGINRVLRPIDL